MDAMRTCLATATVFFCAAAPAEPVSTVSLQPLLQVNEASAPRRVIVGVALSESVRPEGSLDAAQVFAQRARIAVAQDQVANLITRLGGQLTHRYTYLPYVSAQIDAAALDLLMASLSVASITADRLRQPTLLRSAALTGADVASRAGLTGAGWTVALPDTGVDATHPFLAGKVIAEACFSSTFAGNAVQPATVSMCPGGVDQSTTAGAGMNCDAAFADCDHGTHVAGIVAGRAGPDGLTGIAPEAILIALQVYSGLADGKGIGAWDSDLLRALEQVYSLSGQHRIAAVNLSLGGSEVYSEQSACDAEHPALQDAVALLRSVGIATVAAAGNGGSTTGLAAPACLSDVISVGASCTSGPDASFCPGGIDSIAAYSNVASFLGLLAPGSYITSSIPGAGYETLSGTSLAAPHVAAAIALLRQQTQALTVQEALGKLRAAAASIDDMRRGGTARDVALLDLSDLARTATTGNTEPMASRSAGAPVATAVVTPATGGRSAANTSQPLNNTASDSVPDAFTFEAQTGVPLGSVRTSNEVYPTGYDTATTIVVINGQYSFDCIENFTSSPGTIRSNQSVCVRHTATAAPGATVTTTLTIGGVSASFASTTAAPWAAAAVISAGGRHTCAVTTGGGAECWGGNDYAQAGQGGPRTHHVGIGGVVGLSSGVATIAAGGVHTAALTGAGGVKWWGPNYDNPMYGINTPIDVPDLTSGVVAITAGSLHACALTTAGSVKCWGANNYGQLGDGTTTSHMWPKDVVGLTSGVVAIAAGATHTCALNAAGGIKCWGNNGYGQLGDGTTTQRLMPVDVSGLSSGVLAIAAGASHGCAMTTGGALQCWGRNSHGQLGDGTTTDRLVPTGVLGLSAGMTAVAAGGLHTCALTISDGIRCWGNNSYGQLGDGTMVDRSVAVDVVGLSSGIAAIATGDRHTCALDRIGAARCWGENDYGQLGDGTTTMRLTPATVVGLAGTDAEPDAFGFTPVTDVALGAVVTSAPITPSGYDTTASVSVTNGEYSVECSGSFTAAAGTINPGQSVCVRHIASGSPGATVTTVLTVGGVSGGFSSTTLAAGRFALAVSRIGDGTATSDPAGIDCGATCSASYAAGTGVTLTATPAIESTFSGWSGACTGTGACVVAMTEPRSVTASFTSTPKTTEKISALYIAFFTRAADFEGLNFWKAVAWDSALEDRALMRLMAGGFANHPSFAAIYGPLDDSAYIDAIYVNVGGKPADAAGKAYWLGLIGSGQISRADFVADFTYGLLEITEQTLQDLVDSGQITEAERQDALARKYRMQNKTDVAIAFLDALGPASNLAATTDPLDPVSLAQDPAYRASQNILREVTEDPQTMEAPLTYLAGDPTIDGINQLFGP